MSDLFDMQYRELKSVIKPYRKDWNEWTDSPNCFLKKEEVIAVNICLNMRSLKSSIKENETAEMLQYILLKNAITKLSLFHEIFKKYRKTQYKFKSRFEDK